MDGCRVARCALRRGNVPPDIAGPNQPKQDPQELIDGIEQIVLEQCRCLAKGE